jgi:hypothetical protein
MLARGVFLAALTFAASPSFAQQMNPDSARRFVVGKLFAFNCFDGSRGAGRIYSDGSVIGSLQMQGSGPVREMWLPAGTLRVKGEAVCASLKGLPFDPCFNLSRTNENSFRGTVSGMNFAYCDFTRRSNVANFGIRTHPSQPLPLHASSLGTQSAPE